MNKLAFVIVAIVILWGAIYWTTSIGDNDKVRNFLSTYFYMGVFFTLIFFFMTDSAKLSRSAHREKDAEFEMLQKQEIAIQQMFIREHMSLSKMYEEMYGKENKYMSKEITVAEFAMAQIIFKHIQQGIRVESDQFDLRLFIPTWKRWMQSVILQQAWESTKNLYGAPTRYFIDKFLLTNNSDKVKI
jgi:hypothetical protein